MARYKVEICGVNTADIKVLTNEEQISLFKRFQDGDMSAKEELINGNLKLVLSILKPFNNRTDNMDDLFQVGCVGLIKAIDNFDLSHNVRFSTYAVPMILGEVKRYLRDNNSVRIARSIKDLAYKSLKVKEELTNKNGKEPTILEISKALNVSEREVAEALNSMKDVTEPSIEYLANELELEPFEIINAIESMKDPVSLFEAIYNDGGDVIYLADQLNADEGVYDLETKLSLKEALNKLKDREKYILIQRYLIGKTQMELADEIGISQAQISRLEQSGIKTIKKMIQ